jgi:transposase
MASHPEIKLVSRDRGGDYASAAATGAPQAVQCADRFHIVKNLGEAVEGCVTRHLAARRKTHPPDILEEHQLIEQVPRGVRRSRDQLRACNKPTGKSVLPGMSRWSLYALVG